MNIKHSGKESEIHSHWKTISNSNKYNAIIANYCFDDEAKGQLCFNETGQINCDAAMAIVVS